MNDMFLSALIFGALFGFLLQKGRVLRYDKQIGVMRLIDMTIVKFIFTSILVGMIGVNLLHDLGMVKYLIMPTFLGRTIIGGLVFGIGWGLVGYCPGTAIGAVGEGRLDALWAVLGMIAGAGLFAEVFPMLKDTVMAWGSLGLLTFSSVLGLNHWVVIIVFVLAGAALFRFFEKKGL